jgi:hypothetical protein
MAQVDADLNIFSSLIKEVRYRVQYLQGTFWSHIITISEWGEDIDMADSIGPSEDIGVTILSDNFSVKP